jgi:hypothetical protein
MDVVMAFPTSAETGRGLIAILTFIVSFAVLGEITVEGWTSLVLSVWFLAGCTLFSLGLSGLSSPRRKEGAFIIDEIVQAAEMQPPVRRDFRRVANSQDG